MDEKAKRLQCVSDFQKACAAEAETNVDAFRQSFYNLCSAYIQGSGVSLEQVKQAAKPACTGKIPDAECMIVDVLWWLGAELDKASKTHKDQRQRYCELVRAAGDYLIPQDLLLGKLELDVLQDSKLPDGPKFRRDCTRRITQKLYVPSKYNLLRESNEGFAKLLTHIAELHSNGPVATSHLIYTVELLVGYFKLDPFRVHALIQDVFEHDLRRQPSFLELLRDAPRNVCAEVVGFKLVRQEQPSKETSSCDDETSNSEEETDRQAFYKLVALLIKEGMLDLRDIYPLIDGVESDPAPTEGKILPKEGLFIALLQSKMYKVATELLTMGPRWFFGANKDNYVVRELLSTCKGLIEGLYSHYYSDHTLDGAVAGKESQLLGFFNFDLLEHFKSYGIGLIRAGRHYFHQDLVLLTKLTRVLKHFADTQTNEAGDCVAVLVLEVLLPSMSYTSPNPSLCYEIWQVLDKLGHEERFRLYSAFRDQDMCESQKTVAERAERKLQLMVDRLDAKNLKREARSMAQMAHAHPLIVAEKIVRFSTAADRQAEKVVDLLVRLVQYFTPLGVDALLYVLLLNISELSSLLAGKKADDALNPSINKSRESVSLSNLAKFVGLLYRRHCTVVDGVVLPTYIVRRLRSGESTDLVVLESVILSALGTNANEMEVPVAQIQSFAGGAKLQSYCAHDSVLFSASVLFSTSTQMAMKALLQALLSHNLAQPLLLLLGQLRAQHFYIHDASNMASPLIARYDSINDVLQMLMHFFHNSESLVSSEAAPKFTGLSKLQLPSIASLIEDYGIDREISFAFARCTLASRPVWKKEDVAQFLGGDVMKHIPRAIAKCEFSRALYFIFWTLELADLLPSQETQNMYQTAINKLQQELNQVRDKLRKVCLDPTDPADVHKLLAQSKLKEEALSGLSKESTAARASRDAVTLQVQAFIQMSLQPQHAEQCVWAILQECIVPRCVLSAVDATYCAKFVEFLHFLQLPFSLIQLLGSILSYAPYWLTCVTVKEAHRIGVFVHMVMHRMMTWRLETQAYEKECGSAVGFRDKLSDPSTQITHAQFKVVHRRLHEKLTQSFRRCLEVGEWHQQRNCLVALKVMHQVYPLHRKNSDVILGSIDALKSHVNDTLKGLAADYSRLLQQQGYHQIINKEDEESEREAKEKSGQGSGSLKKRGRDLSPTSSSSKKHASAAEEKSKSRPRHKDSRR